MPGSKLTGSTERREQAPEPERAGPSPPRPAEAGPPAAGVEPARPAVERAPVEATVLPARPASAPPTGAEPMRPRAGPTGPPEPGPPAAPPPAETSAAPPAEIAKAEQARRCKQIRFLSRARRDLRRKMDRWRFTDPKWDRIRPNHVLQELRQRNALERVSKCCVPEVLERISQRISQRCSAYLFEVLSDLEERQRSKRLRLRKDRWLAHALTAEAEGDSADAVGARAEAKSIPPATRHRQSYKFVPLLPKRGTRVRTVRVEIVKGGPGRLMGEAFRCRWLALDLTALLQVAMGMGPLEAKKLTLPAILRALRAAYPWLLPRRGLGEVPKLVSRHLAHLVKMYRWSGYRGSRGRVLFNLTKDELLEYRARMLASGSPRLFSQHRSWQSFLDSCRPAPPKRP